MSWKYRLGYCRYVNVSRYQNLTYVPVLYIYSLVLVRFLFETTFVFYFFW